MPQKIGKMSHFMTYDSTPFSCLLSLCFACTLQSDENRVIFESRNVLECSGIASLLLKKGRKLTLENTELRNKPVTVFEKC